MQKSNDLWALFLNFRARHAVHEALHGAKPAVVLGLARRIQGKNGNLFACFSVSKFNALAKIDKTRNSVVGVALSMYQASGPPSAFVS